MREKTINDLLDDAHDVHVERALRGEPLVAAYKFKCACGGKDCKIGYSVTIVPYVELTEDARNGLRRFQS